MPKLLHPRPHRILLLGRVCELEKPDKALVASADISDEEADHLEEAQAADEKAHKGYKVVRGATKKASADLAEEAAVEASQPAAAAIEADVLPARTAKQRKGAK